MTNKEFIVNRLARGYILKHYDEKMELFPLRYINKFLYEVKGEKSHAIIKVRGVRQKYHVFVEVVGNEVNFSVGELV